MFFACGGKTDLSGDDGGGDAARDVRVLDVTAEEVGPPPYQPQGVRCVDTDAAAPLAWAPAADGGAPLRPPIMQSSGGPVISRPIFVPMTFEGDTLRDQIEDFIASVGCTTYWHAIVPDYGVGDGVTGTPVHMTDTPPSSIDDTQIATFIRSKVLANAVPAPIYKRTIYVIYYPDTTDITLQGEHSCQSFGGYHNELVVNSINVPYVVIPRCDGFGQLGGIDDVTGTTSHELIEATTDPLPMSNPAFQFPEPNGVAWALAGGGEIGDLCEFNRDAFFLPSDYAFTVQRGWTSSAAFLANDPCQPNAATYVAAAPILPDAVNFNYGAGTFQTNGVSIAQGSNKTISVKIIASGPWNQTVTVQAQDAEKYLGGASALTFNQSAMSGNVGDTIQLTINRVGATTVYGLAPFVIRATSAGTTRTFWAVVGD